MNLSPLEIGAVLLIILLLFGVGRITKIAGEMGSGVRAFKKGLQGDEEKTDQKDEKEDNEKKSGDV